MEFAKAPLETQMTAIHESGHALMCLIHDFPIRRWSVVQKRKAWDGYLETDGEIRCPDRNIKLSLAGDAAEGATIFWKRNELELPKHKTPYTDIEWVVRAIGDILRCKTTSLQPRRLDAMVYNVYKEIRKTMSTPLFSKATLALACHMTEYEQRQGDQGEINKEMWKVLRDRDIGKSQKIKMRREMDKIDCRDIVRKSL